MKYILRVFVPYIPNISFLKSLLFELRVRFSSSALLWTETSDVVPGSAASPPLVWGSQPTVTTVTFTGSSSPNLVQMLLSTIAACACI